MGSSKGSDAAAKAREADYRFNAANARKTAKRSIEAMFSQAEDYSSQASGTLSQAVALLGKYGYIDKDKYHTRGGTSDLGVTIESTNVETVTDTEGMRERLAEITDSIDEYKDVYERALNKAKSEWSGDIDNAGDRMNRDRDARIQAKRVAEAATGNKLEDLTKQRDSVNTEVEAVNDTEKLIADQGGLEGVSQISTTSAARRIRGSSFDSVMKAKRMMYRDRAKIIREGITTAFDATMAGKHYQEGAEFARQEASYARRQSALNNFFRVTSSAISIIGLGK